MKTALRRTSPSSVKPPDRLPGRKHLWPATPATEQIGQDRSNALLQLAGRCGCPLKGHPPTEPKTDVEAEISTMTVRLGRTCRTPNEPDSRVGATASMSLASTSIATVMQKSRPAARAPTRAVAGRCTDGSGCRSGRCQRRAASGPCPPPCNARTRSQVRPGRSSR